MFGELSKSEDAVAGSTAVDTLYSDAVTKQSSPNERRNTATLVYEDISKYFFEKVVFMNLIYSDLGGGGTTSTTDYGKASRIIDTASGRLMAPGNKSRIRCQFYVKNPATIDGYILSPVVYDDYALPASLTDMSIFRSYVGIKIYNNQIYAAVKEAGKTEQTYLLDFTMTMYDSTYTDTFALEMVHNVGFTEIYLNGSLMGSYSSDMVGTFTSVSTFYPFFSPARSTDGTSVNIVSENIQFIQEK